MPWACRASIRRCDSTAQPARNAKTRPRLKAIRERAPGRRSSVAQSAAVSDAEGGAAMLRLLDQIPSDRVAGYQSYRVVPTHALRLIDDWAGSLERPRSRSRPHRKARSSVTSRQRLLGRHPVGGSER